MRTRPARSMTGATSESAGMCPPGKMYLRVHALVTAGPFMRPIEWMSAMPSALSKSQIFWKNFIVWGADMFEHAH